MQTDTPTLLCLSSAVTINEVINQAKYISQNKKIIAIIKKIKAQTSIAHS